MLDFDDHCFRHMQTPTGTPASPATTGAGGTSVVCRGDRRGLASLRRLGIVGVGLVAGLFGLAASNLSVVGQEVPPPSRQDAPEKKSAKPGINDSFTDPNLDVDEFIKRFEIESREIFEARQDIVRSVGLRAGERIADIGAGTGLFTRMFSAAVGAEGWVFAVDIAPRFIEHINRQAAEHQLRNISGIICQFDSVNLPPDSIDVAFICDTYHHFEFPADTMQSVHRALRAEGRLFVVDFERIPGQSREWVLEHVRAGKSEVLRELESFGFELVQEIPVDRLAENYLLQLRKRKP